MELYYQKSSGRPTLIYLHGWGHNYTVWKKYNAYFKKKGYGALLIDLAGHGNSKNNHTRATIQTYACDVLKVIKKEKIKNYVIVGHSLGGMVAQELYFLDQKNIKGMVLISTCAQNPFKWHHHIGQFLLIVLRYFTRFPYIAIRNKPIDFSKTSSSSVLGYFFKSIKHMQIKDIVAPVIAILRFDILSQLRKVKIPVLLLAGKKDWIIKPSFSKDMALELPWGKYKEIAQASHDVHLNQYKLVREEITHFLGLL